MGDGRIIPVFESEVDASSKDLEGSIEAGSRRWQILLVFRGKEWRGMDTRGSPEPGYRLEQPSGHLEEGFWEAYLEWQPNEQSTRCDGKYISGSAGRV